MATARLVLSVLVVLMAAIALSEGMRGGKPSKCCFSFMERPLPRQRVVDYVKTSQRCPTPAVLLRTVKGQQLCARTTDSWVNDLVRVLDLLKVKPGQQNGL